MSGSVLSGYLLHDGIPLNYLEWGSADSPPVLFLHGLTDHAYVWRPVCERLADRYHCVALSLRGHGDSGPSPQRQYNFALFASDVEALVRHLGWQRFLLVGHSLGGRVSIAYAGSHPQQVIALVVVDVAPQLHEEAAWRIKRTMEATPVEFDSWQAAVDYMAQARPSTPRTIIEERAFYALRPLPNGKVTWKLDPLVREEWLGPGLPPRATADVWAALEQLQCPMLLIKGETSDTLPNADLCERMVRFGRNSRWVEVPGASHWVFDDDLEGFLAVLEPFLAEQLRPVR
jgi:pimeloyl-ACP methyl ester carboxylesterase